MTRREALHEAVRAVLDDIEPGFVATYGDVGRRLGISPRQAGREVSRVPDDVPWWRVVRADGTPAACRGGHAVALLESEGVAIRAGRVDLAGPGIRGTLRIVVDHADHHGPSA